MGKTLPRMLTDDELAEGFSGTEKAQYEGLLRDKDDLISRLRELRDEDDAEISTLQAENDRLREALCDYGEHQGDCDYRLCEAGEPTPDGGYRHKVHGKWKSELVCSCGLTAALDEGEDAE